jgi:hypothetical protein
MMDMPVSRQSLSGTVHPAGSSSPGDWREYSRHCSLAAVDIAGFSRPDRDDEIQRHLRRSLYQILKETFGQCGIWWDNNDDLLHEDRGDGVLIVIDARIPTGYLIDPLVDRLRSRLRRYNRVSSAAAAIQLRMALHAGQVSRDANGFAGEAVIQLCRILNAAALRRALADSEADLALIVSDYVYNAVIRHGPGLIDPDDYSPVRGSVKKTRIRAWASIPGSGPLCSPKSAGRGSAGKSANSRTLRALDNVSSTAEPIVDTGQAKTGR